MRVVIWDGLQDYLLQRTGKRKNDIEGYTNKKDLETVFKVQAALGAIEELESLVKYLGQNNMLVVPVVGKGNN